MVPGPGRRGNGEIATASGYEDSFGVVKISKIDVVMIGQLLNIVKIIELYVLSGNYVVC